MQEASMFIPCMVDLFMPEIGEAVYNLLKRFNIRPIYHEEQTCCGQIAYNSGYRDQARKVARHFIEIFEGDEVVVSPSGSCVYMVKFNYPELFDEEPDWLRRAQSLASRVYELSQYLVDILKVEDVGAHYNGKVAYHEACHILRGLGISEQPKKLIRAVRGTELVAMNRADACCGFGGEFAIHFPDISEGIVKDKVGNFLNSGADILLLGEPGCMLNIGGYLHRNHPEKKVMHLASFLNGST